MDHLYEPDVVDLTHTPPAGTDGTSGPRWAPQHPSGTIPLVPDASAEVIRLQAEVAILQARLQASEEVARERADRIADLRVILRMLPSSSEASASAPTSRVWVAGRPGQAADHSNRMGTAPDPSRIWSATHPGPQATHPPEPSRPIPDWREDFSDFPQKRGRHLRQRRWFGRRRRVRVGR